MWKISSEYIQQMKEELKGRHAAVQALIANELKSLDAEIEEVEAVERLAQAFVAKYPSAGEAATGQPHQQESHPRDEGGFVRATWV